VHFSWRTNSVSSTSPSRTSTSAKSASLARLQPQSDAEIHFIPYCGNFSREFFSASTPSDLTQDGHGALYKRFMLTPFTTVSGQGELPQAGGEPVNACCTCKQNSQLLVTSVIIW
jgi:N-acetyl-gamma-glutamyl-phosphate reductase